MSADAIDAIVSEAITRSATAQAAAAARIAQTLAESGSGAVRAAMLAAMLVDAAVRVAAALTRVGRPHRVAHDVTGLRIEGAPLGAAGRHVAIAYALGAETMTFSLCPGLFAATRRSTLRPTALSRAEFEQAAQGFAREATEFLMEGAP